jgi:putative ABC transport system permease protein
LLRWTWQGLRKVERSTALLARETAWAMRRLWRRPLGASLAVLTVAVAITPSLLFQLVNAAVLPPLAFERSHELVRIWQRVPWRMACSYPKLRYLAEHSHTLDVAAMTGATLSLDRDGKSTRLFAQAVTPNYFDVLRVRPLLGRAFSDEDNRHVLGHPVVVLSESLWRRVFGGRTDVVGTSVHLNGRSFVVIGVVPDIRDSWSGSVLSAEAWIPAMMAPVGKDAKGWRDTPRAIESPDTAIWGGIARVRLGHVLSEARSEAAQLGRQVESLWPLPEDADPSSIVPFDLVGLAEDSVDPKILRAVALLKVAAALLLALGGLNLGSLFLARGLERAKTLGVHTLLGAPRLALLWGALSEALLVSLAGGLAAVMLTRGALAFLGWVEPTILTAPFGVTFDPDGWRFDSQLVALALVLSALTAVVFSIGPAVRITRLDAPSFVRGGAGVTGAGLRGLRLTRPGGLLVAFEMAATVALTLPALLLLRSLGNLITDDLGFRPRGVTAAALKLPAASYSESKASAFVEAAVHDIGQTDDAESASWVSCLPIECGTLFTSSIQRVEMPPRGLVASVHIVAPGAFRTLGIPLREGREFGAADSADAPSVVVVSEEAARQLASDPLRHRIDVLAGGRHGLEVVGVVGDVPYRDLTAEPLPAVYLPLAQWPQTEGFLVTRSNPRNFVAIAGATRRVVRALDPRLETPTVFSLEEHVDRGVGRFRGAAWLLGLAAALAFGLSAVGIYGLFTSLVSQSVPEIGIRMALGAAPQTIGRSIARMALALAAVGLAVGASLGTWGAVHLRSFLYDVRPWDVWTLLLTLIAAVTLALAGAVQPARRASHVDPVIALRDQ